MNIQDATRQASEKETGMYRREWDHATIEPTDTPECCRLIIHAGTDYASKKFRRACPRWDPKLSDLTADDWEVR